MARLYKMNTSFDKDSVHLFYYLTCHFVNGFPSSLFSYTNFSFLLTNKLQSTKYTVQFTLENMIEKILTCFGVPTSCAS